MRTADLSMVARDPSDHYILMISAIHISVIVSCACELMLILSVKLQLVRAVEI